MRDKKSFSDGAGCIVLLVWIVFQPLVYGLVLSQMWSWFVVPVGARCGLTVGPINWAMGYGLALIVSLLTARQDTKEDDRETKDVWELVFMGAFTPLVVLFIGWIVQRWV